MGADLSIHMHRAGRAALLLLAGPYLRTFRMYAGPGWVKRDGEVADAASSAVNDALIYFEQEGKECMKEWMMFRKKYGDMTRSNSPLGSKCVLSVFCHLHTFFSLCDSLLLLFLISLSRIDA